MLDETFSVIFKHRNTALKMYDLFPTVLFCKESDMETRIADLIRNLVTNVFTYDYIPYTTTIRNTNCILTIYSFFIDSRLTFSTELYSVLYVIRHTKWTT